MNRDEFMKELDYLLSDIPDGEKADAVEYYRDYLEEAGPENEEQVIREFGSPERIAAIIRSDITGNLEEGGEFTESGYQDERFKDPNYQMAKRYELPEAYDEQKDYSRRHGRASINKGRRRNSSRAVKIILWIILFILVSPMLMGIGGGLLGLVSGLFGILAAAVVAVGAITAAFLVAGFGLLLAGIVSMVIHPLSGILLFGLGILIFGFGLLALAVSMAFYGKFLPFLFRSGVDAISRLIYRRRERS